MEIKLLLKIMSLQDQEEGGFALVFGVGIAVLAEVVERAVIEWGGDYSPE